MFAETTSTWFAPPAMPSQQMPHTSSLAMEGKSRTLLRERVGEFVGNIFYGTLLKELQNSTIRSELFHGGRGEEAFRSMLNMELARRMGQSPDDPIANHMYAAMVKRRDEKDTTTTVAPDSNR